MMLSIGITNKGIDFFNVAKGKFVAVMAPSGSGKSALLNCISCYIPFEEGKITLGALFAVEWSSLAGHTHRKTYFSNKHRKLLKPLTA